MSAIDLVLLGMLAEGPRSAYDLQKDVDAHHLSRWTKISVPSVYKKVLALRDQGYLISENAPGAKLAEKAVYRLTEAGRARFETLMAECAGRDIPLLLDMNVVVANLNKVDAQTGRALIETLRESLTRSARANEGYLTEYADIPLTGRTILEQQRRLYQALEEWLKDFSALWDKER